MLAGLPSSSAASWVAVRRQAAELEHAAAELGLRLPGLRRRCMEDPSERLPLELAQPLSVAAC